MLQDELMKNISDTLNSMSPEEREKRRASLAHLLNEEVKRRENKTGSISSAAQLVKASGDAAEKPAGLFGFFKKFF